MATVNIWKIDFRLDHVIGYTTDKEKTSSDKYLDLHNVLKYVEADFKTEDQLYVSALNCGVSTAFKEMKITKKQWNKEDGILGYHAFQSFKGREVTPEVAHEIGLKFAEEIWGDRFEVVVSTHLNTENIHNHFVINSVSFKDGKKYLDKRETQAKLRETSDTLCEEYGISFLQARVCRRSGINYGNYYEKYKQHNNYYTDTKSDIDKAILQAYSYRDFENLLKAMNYDLIYRAEKLSVRKTPYKKNIRVHRAFGENYTREMIEERIKKEFEIISNNEDELKYITKYSKHNDYKKEKLKGIYGLFLHYCYLLKVFPTKYPKRVLIAELRADIKKMDSISKQTVYLVENKIETEEQLQNIQKELSVNLRTLFSKREVLWTKYNKSTCEEEQFLLRQEINKLSKGIDNYRMEVKLCEEINKRLEIVNDTIEKHYKNNERKER